MSTQKQKNYGRIFHLENYEQRLILVLGDLLSGFLAMGISLYIWASGDSWLKLSVEFLKHRAPTWFYLLPLFWVLLLFNNYDLQKAGSFKETTKGVGVSIAVATIIYLVLYFAFPPSSLPRLGVAVFILCAAILTLLWRFAFTRLFRAVARQRRVLIIGAGKAGTALCEVIAKKESPPFNLVGLIDDDPEKLGTQLYGFTILGNHEKLNEIIEEQQISDLILAISNEMNSGMFQSLLIAQESGIRIQTMAGSYESLTGRIPIRLLESDWIIRSFLEHTPNSGFYRILKRVMDICFSLAGFLVFVLLLPFLGIAILLDDGRPIFYTQTRLGRGGQPYSIYKLRTLRTHQDMATEGLVTVSNDPRITRVGHFLRKSHLDELPQVINVLRGEMSLVGPRSERDVLVSKFQNDVPFYRARMLVKPGITGWAQIHQAYAETVDETAVKLEYDLYYIQHASLIMDLQILWRTVGTVLGLKGR